MTRLEAIAAEYGQDVEWAVRFTNLFEAIAQDFDVFAEVCRRSSDAYADAACLAPINDSPSFAYNRGRSDAYRDMPGAFFNQYNAFKETHDGQT